MTTRTLIKETLSILNINGVNPTKTGLIPKINAFTSIVLSGGVTAELLMEALFNWNGLDSLAALVEFVACYLATLKLVILVLQRDNFKNILDIIDNYFVPLNRCPPALQNKIMNTNRAIKNIMFTVIGIAVVTILAYLVLPLFSNVRALPAATYHPTDLNNSRSYHISYLIQFFIIVKCLPISVLSFDFLFVSLVTHTVSEFQIIKERITAINFGKNNSKEASVLEELSSIGVHHSMVLRCVKYLKETYSILLLNQFLAVLFLICLTLLAVIIGGYPPDFGKLTKDMGVLIVFSSLLFLYCAGGSYLTFESENIARAAYETNWWIKTQPKTRRSIALVILRSQKTEALMAGGMIKLSLETFTGVVKNGLSFFMVVQTLFKKSEKYN